VKLSLIDEFGVPEAAKEAVLFAIIGFLTVQQLAGSVASCTGARESNILGAIIPGRQELSHLAPDAAPTGLSFLNSAAEVRG
jgi:anhydro-N-acetylmuramic acid kinase